MTDLPRVFASAFEALKEHSKLHPEEAQTIASHIAAHLRSAFPMSLLVESVPVLEPAPAAAIERRFGNGSYRVSTDEGHVVLMVEENDGGPTCAVLERAEAEVLRADLKAVMA